MCLSSGYTINGIKLGMTLFSFDTASLPPVRRILTEHEDEFFACVNAKYNVLRLKRKHVLSQEVVSTIQAASDEEAKEILYDHLMNHGTVDAMKEWCKWAMFAEGYQNMQEFGRKVMDELT